MKEYRVKLKHDLAQAMVGVIDQVITHTFVGLDDTELKMYLAALEEVKIRLMKKLVVFRPAYLTTFSPVQALALRLLYSDWSAITPNPNPYTQNKLRIIADEVHKHYSL